ncbi:MAG TPA: hypothetical protein VFC19_31720 [Candidatus Limnocylindrales bacterium]|nr:hypothetical protein [Candidatus Limnocylindrales bacterium]
MDLLLLVATAAALSFGVAGLAFDFRPGIWRKNPPWMFAGTMFCFTAALLAMYGRRQVEAASSLAALLSLVAVAGLTGAVVLMLKARKRQAP